MAKFDLTSTGKILALIIIVLLSLTLLITPIFAPEEFAFPLQAAGILGSFIRGALVPMLWDTEPYLLAEFAVAVISVVYVTIKNCELPALFIQGRTNDSLVGPTQTPLSFPSFWFIAALIGFIGFEGLFFLVVRMSSKELGFFGQFHVFLWTLLKSLGLGIAEVIKAVAVMLYGLANAATCTEDQLLNSEEGVESRPVGGPLVGNRPVGDRTIGNHVVADRPAKDHPTGDRPTEDRTVGDCSAGDRPVEEPEASPPPPYVSALPSIMFTAHQDPIM